LDEEASREHQDLDQSGFNKNWKERPGLMAHLKAAQAGLIQHIVFYKLSRVARRTLDGLEIFQAFESAGCAVHVIKDNIDTSTSAGRMIRTVLLGFAEQQAEDQSDQARDVILRRVQSGKHHGELPGWMMRASSSQIDFREPYASALLRLVELRLVGMSGVKIAAQLNREGHRRTRGGLWGNADVAEILSPDNRLRMAGYSILGRGLPQDDPARIVTAGIFPALLSQEVVAALNTLQRTHEASPATQARLGRWSNSRSASTRWLLSGLIWCPHCGGRLYSLTGGQTKSDDKPGQGDMVRGTEARPPSPCAPVPVGRRYYHCIASRSLPEAHPGAKTFLVNAHHAEEATLIALTKALEMLKIPTCVKPALKQSSKLEILQRQQSTLTHQVDALFELHSRGILSTGDFERRYQELAAQRVALTQQEDEESAPQVLAQAQRLAALEEPTQETLRQLILLLVARVDCPDSGERAARIAEGRTDAAARAPRREVQIHPKAGLFSWSSASVELRTMAYKGEREIQWRDP
uniref:recombinase family protein n=1 Tax=Armatimonas sp. TaxID=1872638 RepID=UPI00375347CA